MRVVRLAHSAVVFDWRTRERLIAAAGVDLTLLIPRRWPELASMVELTEAEPFVTAIRTRGRHPYLFVFGMVPLLRALRRGVDVFDVHEEPPSLAAAEALLARWVTRRTNAPIVFYSAQNIYKRYPPPFSLFERLFLRSAAGAYVCNQDAAKVLRRKGFRGQIEVIPLGVDTGLFDDSPSAAPEQLVIGFVGRLDPDKGVDVLLAAAALVPEVSVRVVGDGSQRGHLEARARELGVADRVEFLGVRPRHELPAFFRGLTALAVPSIPTDRLREQFGRVVAEAMTVGTPVIATSGSSLPEVVGPGGIIVPPVDADELASAIRTVADPETRAKLSDEARAWARRFTWEAVATKHMQLYASVLRR